MKLFYYCALNGIKILENLEIKITAPNLLNDPFEFLPYPDGADPSLDDFNKTIAFQRASHGFFYFLSMTKNDANPRMWAQYAANHTGLMFEFDMMKEPFRFLWKERKALIPVEYNHVKRVPLSIYGSPQDLEVAFRALAARKGSYWKEEEEMRLVVTSDWLERDKLSHREFVLDDKIITLLKITEDAIVSVTLGHRSSNDLMDTVRHMLRRKFRTTKLYHAKMSDVGFEMVREKVGIVRPESATHHP